MKTNLPIITGLTASGKTSLACKLANTIHAEIIGADSRQVYKYMDIGTGKDLEDFTINGNQIPYHLIDFIHPNTDYHIDKYKADFKEVISDLNTRNKTGILCGGSVHYIQNIVHNNIYTSIPINTTLREELINLDKDYLITLLNQKELPFNIDTNSKKRIIRGIEIQNYLLKNQFIKDQPTNNIVPQYFICYSDVNQRKEKITKRLKERLENGMIEEVENLLGLSISHERLQHFGLEYKYISKYMLGEYTYSDFFEKLNTAIHQYAKRQMTWMRKITREEENVTLLDCSQKPSIEYLDLVLKEIKL